MDYHSVLMNWALNMTEFSFLTHFNSILFLFCCLRAHCHWYCCWPPTPPYKFNPKKKKIIASLKLYCFSETRYSRIFSAFSTVKTVQFDVLLYLFSGVGERWNRKINNNNNNLWAYNWIKKIRLKWLKVRTDRTDDG